MTLQTIAAVGLYAALNSFILFALTIATSRLRGHYKVMVGDGGVAHLTRIMRGHANAAETMPMMMVLISLSALMGAPLLALHVLGIMFTVGRAVHAWHFVAEDAPVWQRAGGFALSALAMVAAALGVFGHALWLLV